MSQVVSQVVSQMFDYYRQGKKYFKNFVDNYLNFLVL